jgi:hypothetical protein
MLILPIAMDMFDKNLTPPVNSFEVHNEVFYYFYPRHELEVAAADGGKQTFQMAIPEI